MPGICTVGPLCLSVPMYCILYSSYNHTDYALHVGHKELGILILRINLASNRINKKQSIKNKT